MIDLAWLGLGYPPCRSARDRQAKTQLTNLGFFLIKNHGYNRLASYSVTLRGATTFTEERMGVWVI